MKKIITSLCHVSLIVCLLFVSSCDKEDEGERGAIGSLSGTVTDVNGKALEGVTITLNPIGKTTETESDGSYFFYNFTAGEYVLTASLKEYDTFEQEITIEADQTITIDIKLTNPDIQVETGSITGIVTNEDGEVLKGVTIGFLETETVYTTNSGGVYKFYIKSGEYTLYAKLDNYHTYYKSVTIVLEEELTEDIVLVKDEDETYIIDFNGLLENPETEYVGYINPDAEEWDYTESTFTDAEGRLTFNHYTTANGAYFGKGFTYTNKTDLLTNSFTNSSAITAQGYTGDTYLICSSDNFNPAIITLNKSSRIKGFYITNATYTYLTMKDGGEFTSGPFGTNDYFKVIIIGKLNGNETNSVEYYLAKDGTIVNTWEWVELAFLGEVDELNFDFESSDVGDWGINTPTYFCLDQITVVASK